MAVILLSRLFPWAPNLQSSAVLFPPILKLSLWSKFPDVDGFVVYYEVEHKLEVCGYQAKTGRAYPKKDAPQNLTRALLLRGKAPATGCLRRGWGFMSSEDVQQLLGYSLEPMYPDTWPDYHPPNNDGFD